MLPSSPRTQTGMNTGDYSLQPSSPRRQTGATTGDYSMLPSYPKRQTGMSTSDCSSFPSSPMRQIAATAMDYHLESQQEELPLRQSFGQRRSSAMPVGPRGLWDEGGSGNRRMASRVGQRGVAQANLPPPLPEKNIGGAGFPKWPAQGRRNRGRRRMERGGWGPRAGGSHKRSYAGGRAGCRFGDAGRAPEVW
jgi:hypothetical protein